ncbi:MAG: HDIG domain-containing protein [Bacteroidia bacterium]|nr:HDIG domain-containing protein [Bacteroidia bacterium]
MELKRTLRVFYLRKLRDREFLVRMLIIMGFLAFMTILIPRSAKLGYIHEVGKPWLRESVRSEVEFHLYKSPDQFSAEIDSARASVLPILEYDSTQIDLAIERFQKVVQTFRSNLIELRKVGSSANPKLQDSIKQHYFLEQLDYLDPLKLPEGVDWISNITGRAPYIISRLGKQGYLGSLPVTSAEFVWVRINPSEEIQVPLSSIVLGKDQLGRWLEKQSIGLTQSESRVLGILLAKSIEPTLTYSDQLTQQAKQDKENWVSRVQENGKVNKGATIVQKGDIVTEEISEKLDAMVKEARAQGGKQPRGVTTGRVFLIFLLTMLLLTFLRVNRPRIFFSNQKIALVLTTILLVVAAMVVATKLNDVAYDLLNQNDKFNLTYIFLAPACIVPIFMNNFFDHRVAFFTNLIVAFYGAVLVQQGLEYAFVQLVAGTVAVYSLRRLRKREVFFYTLGFIFLGYTVAFITFNLYSKGNLDAVNFNTLLLFGVNVLLTIIAYNLIYLFEQVFRVTSDLTYLELLDTNHPLLKDLAKKAPGTFQHSLQVANIAEAVVNEIGGNALLIHVGALYHDIGKMAHPRYFIENLQDDLTRDNPHDKLSCMESADMIIGHVAKGISMAQRYHLPRELVHFIETHHGTTRVEFFYRKHLKEKNCKTSEDEDLFRYPGPLPFSKETAVLMMADSVEAASRSLKSPTIESLNDLVDKIVDHKIADDQLLNSPLTFRDISVIRDVLKRQLHTIYHGRIEYPKATEETTPLYGGVFGK